MANTAYRKTSVSGGSSEALDSLSGAILVDGDLAFVSAVGINYVYVYDSDNAGVELVPSCIAPDILPGNGRWILQVDYASSAVTASTAELNIMDGVTNSMAEMNLIDGSVAGTAVASKVLALGASRDIDTIDVTKDGLKIGAVAMTCTAAELNVLDGITASTAELNYLDNVTSNVQTQLTATAESASPVFTGLLQFGVEIFSYYSRYATYPLTTNVVGINGDVTDHFYSSLAEPVAGQRFTAYIYSAAGLPLNNNRWVTCPSGVTVDGTNRQISLDSGGTGEGNVIDMVAISTTRWVILKNIGCTLSNP
jgi:hypothetical protein